jgi:HSP20 family protein
MGLGALEPVFPEIERLRREFDEVFGTLTSDPAMRPTQGGGAFPIMRALDTGNALTMTAELPGFTTKDFTLHIDQDALTLRGIRNEELRKGYTVHRQERGQLEFTRTLALPCKVDAEKAVARMRNGILTVELPKAAESQPRQIAVTMS